MKQKARKSDAPKFDLAHSMGEVDLLGLDEFGQVPGPRELWGGVIGAALQTGTAIGVRQLMKPAPGAAASPLLQYSELLGAGAAAVAGGIMFAFDQTRAMGLTAAAVGLISGGLRFAEQMLATPSVATTSSGTTTTTPGTTSAGSGPTSGWGLGEVVPQVIPSLGAPLGIVTPQVVPTLGAARAGIELMGPPSLQGLDRGFAQHPGAAQVKLLGGPPLSEFSRHFGSTLFSPGQ